MTIRTDRLGIPVFDSQEIVEILYKGRTDHLEKIIVESSEELLQFKNYLKTNDDLNLNLYQDTGIDLNSFDYSCQSQWLMPNEFLSLDIESYLIEKCSGDSTKINRIETELKEYKEKDLYNVLRFMIFLVDFMKNNNIVWGVGRGSSVASYVLYLIGIHRVDSILYNLDFHEFMR